MKQVKMATLLVAVIGCLLAPPAGGRANAQEIGTVGDINRAQMVPDDPAVRARYYGGPYRVRVDGNINVTHKWANGGPRRPRTRTVYRTVYRDRTVHVAGPTRVIEKIIERQVQVPATPPAVPPQQRQEDRDRQGFWLLPLLVALLILGLLGHIFASWRRRDYIRNTATFGANGRSIGARTVRVPVDNDGCRQMPEKTACNLSAGDSAWSCRPTAAMLGDTVRYCLRVRNNAATSVSADTVWVADAPDNNRMRFVPGSGKAKINTSEFLACPIPDEMMHQLLYERRRLRMSDIPGMRADLPANSSLYIHYDMVRHEEDTDVADDAEYVVPPTPPTPTPEPTTPPPPPAAGGPDPLGGI